MRILIIGSGGREHAIVWAIRNTSRAPVEVFCAPGNAGIAQICQPVNVSVNDHSALADFAASEKMDLTFVGPEAPLAAGIVDLFAERGLRIVGPSRAASRLEGSKIFAKDFMTRHGIPTAAYRAADSPQQAIDFLRTGAFGFRAVIKADGLAAGKGVVVAANLSEAEQAVEDLMVNHAAGRDAAERILIEETLTGTEASLLLFADGRDYALMPAARDHKRIGENDTGPNTGGMGTITDASVLSRSMEERVVRDIIEPTLAGARAEGFPFKGVLFLGLMLTEDGPKLLEYNVRFGDPETQAILIRLQTDLVAIFEAIVAGKLREVAVQWRDQASACVVLASGGYPGKYEINLPIHGLNQTPDADDLQVFHAGTAVGPSGELVTAGGRVLGVTAAAATLEDALEKCYGTIDKISWPGMQYRRDIGRFREFAAGK